MVGVITVERQFPECVKQVFKCYPLTKVVNFNPPFLQAEFFPYIINTMAWSSLLLKDEGHRSIIQKRKTTVPETSLCCSCEAPSPLAQFSQLTPPACHTHTHLHSSCAMVGSYLPHTAPVGAQAAQHFRGRPVWL